MIQQNVVIINKLGLHARAATLLVKLAETYDADITIVCNGMEADAKSIMDVLMLAATVGTEISITIAGDDTEEEEIAINRIVNIINDRLTEKE